jgi:hypothetical protein
MSLLGLNGSFKTVCFETRCALTPASKPCLELKIPRVVQDGGDDAAIGDGATVRNLNPFRGARQIHEMFGRPDARVIGRGARVS